MKNFRFRNPVELIFGKGKIATLADKIKPGARVMVTYGGGSIKRNGVYEQVMDALKACTVIEFGGIEANPDYATVMKAVEICKKENVEMLLAVGGGSIIDGTKFIAAATKYEGDPWVDILEKRLDVVKDALPFAVVLTMSATGSEMNCGAVISRRETKEKYAFGSEYVFPQFSILDPSVLFSLPKRQIANGVVDTFAHTLEQYLTFPVGTRVMDRWAEGLLQTLIEVAPSLLTDGEKSYEDFADFMLTATMGLNGFIAMGVVQDWSTHKIGHELTALCGLDHGVTLAIVYPGVMDIMRREKEVKLLQYGERVFGITEGTVDERIDKAIAATEEFFKSVGMKIRLSDYGIGEDIVQTIVTRLRERGWNVGEKEIVTPEKVEEILHRVM